MFRYQIHFGQLGCSCCNYLSAVDMNMCWHKRWAVFLLDHLCLLQNSCSYLGKVLQRRYNHLCFYFGTLRLVSWGRANKKLFQGKLFAVPIFLKGSDHLFFIQRGCCVAGGAQLQEMSKCSWCRYCRDMLTNGRYKLGLSWAKLTSS